MQIGILISLTAPLSRGGGGGGGPAVPYTFAGVTGINIAPPADNWRAASLGMTTDRRDALLAGRMPQRLLADPTSPMTGRVAAGSPLPR